MPRNTRLSALLLTRGFALTAVLPLVAGFAPIARVAAQTPTPAAATARASAYPNTFVKTVFENFDAWDTDHDGVLSEKELDALIVNPRITGQTAATAATLKLTITGKLGPLPPLTKDYFTRYIAYAHEQRDRLASTPSAAVKPGDSTASEISVETGTSLAADKSATPPPFPAFRTVWHRCLDRIQKTPHTIFTGDLPQLSSIHQGQIGDCYFLSMVGALVARDPAQVKGMIKSRPDGSCDVTFPHGETAHVPALTDGQLAVSSTSDGTGTWVAVLESAFGRVREQQKGGLDEGEVATDLIKKGGSIRKTITFLSGHPNARVALRKAKIQEMPTADEAAPKLAAIRAGIVPALKDKRLVGAGTEKVLLPKGVSGNHAYAVLSYDAATDIITLWNPHGETSMPKGAPGLENGYETKNGVFSLPLIDFARIFNAVTWELPAVAEASLTPAR